MLTTQFGIKERIIDLSVLVVITAFILSYFEPRFLLLKTTATGGDTGSHFYTAQYLRDYLIPQGRITGWTQGNYAGFPMLQFYFPLPFLLMVGLSVFMPLQISFKLITVLGTFLLPICAYFSFRLMGFLFPVPIIAALFTLPFLFMEANSMWGGNILSTMAGEFSFSLGLSLAVLFLGCLYRGIFTGKHAMVNGLLIFLVGFSHIVILFLAGLASSFFLWTTQDFLRKFRYLLKVHLMGFLLLAFWIVPLLVDLPFSTGFNFHWLIGSIFEVFPIILLPFLILTVLKTIIEIFRLFSNRRFETPFYYLWYWVFMGVICYFAADQLGIVNIRFLPFVQVSLLLLGALAFQELMQKAKGQYLLTGILYLAVILWVDHHVSSIPSWIAWNYSGFEKKSVWPQFSQVNELLKGSPNQPRVMSEHSALHNVAGTTRAFESLPLFSGRSTLEGLYMHASISAPFIFNIQSEISIEASCPIINYACARHDLDRGIKHLEMFNVRDLVVISGELKSELKEHTKFRLKKSIPPYDIYELTAIENRYVVPLKYEPVVLMTEDWKTASYQWFKDFKNNDVHLVFPVGTNQSDLRRFSAMIGDNSKELDNLPRIPVDVAGEIEETITHNEVLINTSLINKPLLVKISYHPNWKVEGADKIYLVSPSFMLIYPTQNQVRLYYGRSIAESIGLTSSFLGLTVLFLNIPLTRRKLLLNLSLIGGDILDRLLLNREAFTKTGALFLKVSQVVSQRKRFVLVTVAVFLLSFVSSLILMGQKDDPLLLLNAGIRSKEMGDHAEARRNFEKIMRRYPVSPMAEQANYYYAISYYLEDNCEQTIVGFRHFINKYSDSGWIPEAYFYLGECNRKLGSIEKANQIFEYVVDKYPSTIWAQYSQGKMSKPGGN